MSNRSIELKNKKKELDNYRDHVARLENDLLKLTNKAIAESGAEAIRAYELDKINNPSGLNRTLIRDFLCYEKDAHDLNLEDVSICLLGSGPWDKSELNDFLLSKSFECSDNAPDAQIVILGELINSDEENDLLELVYQDPQIKVYTQELFIYQLITGEDPLVTWEEECLLDSVNNHKGMDIILSFSGFTWPSENIDFDDVDYSITEIDVTDWDEESPLRKLGYTVREGALSEQSRREILNIAFNDPLKSYLKNDSERKRWGSPRSAQRLYAIAHFIDWLNKFQGNVKPAAAGRWKSDLQWLKKAFYVSRMHFKWPHSEQQISRKVKPAPFNEKTNQTKSQSKLVKTNSFKTGQRVFHEKYGWGQVVERLVDKNQIKVLFPKISGEPKVFDRAIAHFYHYPQY